LRLCCLLKPIFSAPGEPDDREIIVRGFLLYPAEMIPQIAVSHKKAQPFALIAVPIFLQNMFSIHGYPPLTRYENLRFYLETLVLMNRCITVCVGSDTATAMETLRLMKNTGKRLIIADCTLL
jgi:hypothetical protein